MAVFYTQNNGFTLPQEKQLVVVVAHLHWNEKQIIPMKQI